MQPVGGKKKEEERNPFPRVDHLPEIDLPTSAGWRQDCHAKLAALRETLRKAGRRANVLEQLAERVKCAPANITQLIGVAPGKKSAAQTPPYSSGKHVLRISEALGVDLPPRAALLYMALRLEEEGAEEEIATLTETASRFERLPDDARRLVRGSTERETKK